MASILIQLHKSAHNLCMWLFLSLPRQKDTSKMKKQFEYADKKAIPFVLIVGSDEIEKGEYTLKNMLSGEQSSLKIEQIIEKLNV